MSNPDTAGGASTPREESGSRTESEANPQVVLR